MGIDYSFLRLKDNLADALNMQDSPVTTHFYLNPIQLLTNKTYTQITNYSGGLSLTSDCEVFIVDKCDNVLADITENVFLEEFTDNNGDNQVKFELVNLGRDFYREDVLIRFNQLSSDAVYWTNPIHITDYQSEKTTFLKYRNYDDFMGIGYTNANVWQSISLSMYFDIPLDETETEDYFQISRNITISSRALYKVFEQYAIEQINNFTYTRLNILFKHNIIYLDDVRVTNKPVVPSSEREGQSNFFVTDVVVAKNYNDVSTYEFQIFNGLILSNYIPNGYYSTGAEINTISFSGNVNLTLGEGTLSIYNSLGTLQDSFTEADMVVNDNVLTIDTSLIYTDDTYYINITEGLVSAVGVCNDAIYDNETWTFELRPPDYSSTDYSAVDYDTGIANPVVDNRVLFYKFNETSGTIAEDSTSNGNDGTIVNVNINQTGLIDKCYEFNNGVTDEYVTIPSNSGLNFGDGAFSIEVWVKPSADFGNIINKYNASTGELEWQLFNQSGVLQFYIYTDASNKIGIADNVTITTGVWQQIVLTYDGAGALKMKVDNVESSFSQVETGTFTGMPATTQPIVLGQQADNLTGVTRYSGLMDILRIWKGYALDNDEITTLFNSGSGTEA